MGGLQELGSESELSSFLGSAPHVLVCFSAVWCGPCKASKPQLQQMAQSASIPFGIIYEHDIGDAIHSYSIRAFPTYVLFGEQNREVQRIEGVNFAGISAMISEHVSVLPTTGGNTLGGGTEASSASALTPQEARAKRLAKLGGGGPAATASPEPMEAAPAETEKKPAAKEAVPMETEDEPPKEEEKEASSPVDDLDKEALKTLTESMGFSLLRAQKGLLFGNGSTVESAVEWLIEHQDDADIDEPIPESAGGVAQSYKCNECGKILSNMANLELHANKTGHSDFEESTQAAKQLTPEEKAAKILEIKELLKAKRAEREDAEKVDNVEREKQRRFMGKEMAKTREQMEVEQRKREALARKREKEAFKKERARIRAELEKDRMERMANKGKLSSKLGVDGYNPDGIQYEVTDGTEEEPAAQKRKTASVNPAKIDEYIGKVSAYRAGGDGGKCLKILKIYVSNVVEHPDEEKYRTINMDNKAYKAKVKPFLGAKQLLLAVGFGHKEGDPTVLVLSEDADPDLLKQTKEKLEAALIAYG